MIKGDDMRLVRYLLILLLCFCLGLFIGCRRSKSPVPPAQKAIQDVSRYFPVDQNLLWVYEGEGNEYAGFTREVMYRWGDRVQIVEDNGGTRMVMVFHVMPEEITKTYVMPEFYTDKNLLDEPGNQAEQVLKAPLKVGMTWQDDRRQREVMSIDETVTVPNGTFTNVVKIRVVFKSQSDSQLVEYYAPDVGLILREYTSGNNFKVSSKLKTLTKKESGQTNRQ